MKVLAIETSGALGGFAVVDEGGLLAELVSDLTGSHVEQGVGMLEEVMDRASVALSDLDGVAVSLGPGSFTGLRVGLSMAKGLCLGRNLLLVGVPTLDCIAQGLSYWEGTIIPVRDARRGEIYFSIYSAATGTIKRLDDFLALPPEGLLKRIEGLEGDSKILLAGDGLARYGRLLRSRLGSQVAFAPQVFWTPRPAMVGTIGLGLLKEGRTADLDRVEPMYVRASEAERQARGRSRHGDHKHKENDGR